MKFPPKKVYGIAIDHSNSQIVYASGIFGSFAKIYKSVDGGEKWDEIYTEPTKDAVLTSLVTDPKESNTLYAGTSKGLILKSADGGATWSSIYQVKTKAPITDIVFDAQDNKTIYFVMYKQGLLKSRDGNEIIDFTSNLRTGELPQEESIDNIVKFTNKSSNLSNARVTSIATDPNVSGTLYVGTDDGVYKSTNYANSWKSLNVIASAKDLSVKAIAINPYNNKELVYSVARTFYRSGNDMTEWTPIQISGLRTVSVIRFDPIRESVIYVGMRKEK